MKYTALPQQKPSFAEQLIINKLMLNKVQFDREVTFDGLVNPSTNAPLRYDFYVPCFNLIIEYDGIVSHSTKAVKQRDKIKNNFATRNNITLYRISGIENIDVFFESAFWKRKIKKPAIHIKRVTPTPAIELTSEQKERKTKAEIIEILNRRNSITQPSSTDISESQREYAIKQVRLKHPTFKQLDKRFSIALAKEIKRIKH